MTAGQPLEGTTAIVTGASHGFGSGIAAALDRAGAAVIGVARDARRLEQLGGTLSARFVPVVADVADPSVAGQLLDRYRLATVVLNAGARPLARPIHHHTWETFSRNWDVDVKQVFHWTREALLLPLMPGSTVITMSSGAALRGSPLSGGYAGAKATVRFITAYAADEAKRAALDLRFVSLLPQLTPATSLGAAAVASYALRAGTDLDAYLGTLGATLTLEQVGDAVVRVASDTDRDSAAMLLTASGLAAVP